ncbi:MAG: putative O-glycosylation ligase, exosortase A system-associated [Rhodospirillaceae bacterium]|nr:putative O-glycosylation ligase, exosortase A system-associated [Rhodospirillaceae bacterium]
MRDILVTMIIVGSLPMTLMRPYIGVIMWFLVSYMNFHRMSWGFAYSLPVAMMVGLATLGTWAITKEKHPIPKSGVAILMGMFFIWTVITTGFAVGDDATDDLKQFFKIILMTYVTISLMQTPKRLRILIWVTFVSLGFFSVKGGVFTILTGGSFRVWGPPQTFVEDNNALAMATLMIVPLCIYLAKTVDKKWARQLLFVCAGLSIVSVIGSYSRGAFLSLIVLGGMLWWRSKKKFAIGIAGVCVIAVGMTLLPQKYYDRINSLGEYEEDGSATGRLDIWAVAIDIVERRPITGGGFNVHNTDFAYVNQRENFFWKSFHSIYFEVLAYHGYVGLLLFLALGIAAYRSCGWMRKRTKDRPDLYNENQLALFMQCCVIAYASAGAFQNLAHYDLYYGLLAIIIIARQLLEQKLKLPARASALQPAQADSSQATITDASVPEPAHARSFLRTQADTPVEPEGRSFLR